MTSPSTVVVAPHPDDEVLGCTAILHQAAATVIHVTDGVPPWTPAAEREALHAARRAECLDAWASLGSTVEPLQLGFGDLEAWRSVPDIADSLAAAIDSTANATDIYVPAFQRGHPDHDATYLAAALAREKLGRRATPTWWVYGLYGFDSGRQLRFGWLPPDLYGPIGGRADTAPMLEAKAGALREYSSQVWPDSALDLWIQSPVAEYYAPLPTGPVRLPDLRSLPCYYDEELGFGEHGASTSIVEKEFRRALDPVAH
jgi:LmbE family N-acetylglucosaminyl deacetylase